jgi:TolB protein
VRVVVSLLFMVSLLFGADATINVVKKVDTLPSIVVEDASINYDNTFKMRFFKALTSDLNVLSLFNVDSHYYTTYFNNTDVLPEEKESDYALRYRLYAGDDNALNVDVKLLKQSDVVMQKSYTIANKNLYVFLSHAIAYDINNYMGASPVAWMKRKVIFSRLTAPGQSEIVISDYTLSYQYVIVKGGLSIFPKWANKEQSAFYYTSLNGKKPLLKKVDVATGKVSNILSSDGMVICSDVNDEGTKLLVTMAPHGQPDIYLYDVGNKHLTRLTHFSGIDVNGQFLGDNKIVFISNRLGYPNLFSKVIGSNAVNQMVFYGNSNTSCNVHGHYIAYKARETNNAFSTNTFNLHLMSTQTDFIRRLTATGVNEFPRFSQDGDAILFIKNYQHQSAVGIIRLSYNKNYLFPLKYGKIQSIDW